MVSYKEQSLAQVRAMKLRLSVLRRLAEGWVPWVHANAKHSGSVEEWARFDDRGRLETAPLTPPEGELVSDIMREANR